MPAGARSFNKIIRKSINLMSNSPIRISTPGKLILLGEYAVLEHAPCLVVAVDRNCVVQIDSVEEDAFRIEASNPDIPDLQFIIEGNNNLRFKNDLSLINRKRLRFVVATLKHVFERNNEQLNGATIHIDTDSFYHIKTGHKLGLGASAAITVSLLAALMEYVGKPICGNDLYREAYPVHRKAQGKLGSGSDIAASAAGGIIKYRMPEPATNRNSSIQSLEWPQDLQMIPIWAGRSASTQNLVRRVQIYRNEAPAAYKAIMNPMIALSEAGCRAFESNDSEGFLDIISDFALQEKKLGEASQTDILSGVHKKIMNIVKNAGGMYKPSGAGGGDIGVAFCSSTETSFQVKDAIEKSSFEVLDVTLQSHTLKRIETNKAG